jgi:uroporphyrinogen decarboxylase
VPLSHRERVQLALDHQIPDRCPMQISFTPEFAARLMEYFSLGNKPEPHGGIISYELERHLGQDMLLTSGLWDNSHFQKYKPGEEFTDEWGIGWKSIPYETKFGSGIYTEMIHHPLKIDKEIGSYRPPDPNLPELYCETEQAIRDFKSEYWIVGVTVTTIFEKAWALRGYEQILMDMLINPDLVDTLFEFPFRYHLSMARKLVEMGVDMIWIGDDIGAQHSMLIAPEQWRRFLKDKMAEFIQSIKSVNPNVKVAYHSDGYIYPIIPDLIEIGLDVLNPIQPGSMNPLTLKNEFGDKLCFWGGIDEQLTLPFGSADDVKKEVSERVATLGKNGGLIIGPTHHVQLDTPIDNFIAMVKAVEETY